MANFKKQIEEDIREYQEKFTTMSSMAIDEWAFNFWVLDKFFYEEEELIIDKITDYSDYGIDAFEWYEETKDLYLIQNKYYDENTKLKLGYIQNTFLVVPLAVLSDGKYTRCKELQEIYKSNINNENFTIHLQLYITNDQTDEKILNEIKQFNIKNSPSITAEIFYLSDMENKWYGESKIQSKSFNADIESVNNGTILNINNEAYHLANTVDAKYVFAPISCMYNMVKNAQDKNYELFEKNIREYLGNKGINKKIYLTLKDENERKNFFYYNNGITILCSKIGAPKTITSSKASNNHSNIIFTIDNPQIVNGCQTVNSIFAALKEYDDADIKDKFADTFVMLKILQIDSTKESQKALSKNIVTYNNSQNSLDEKQFVANNELFQRIKMEFADKGFLLLTKQSDKNTYASQYSKRSDLSKLQMLSISRRQIFGLETLKKVTDFEIPLEKFLQVILAFKVGGLAAYTMKKDVLKPETATYNTVTEFIKAGNVTTEILLNLYLLYLRFEKEKTAQSGKFATATPIPFYAIDGFGRFECGGNTNNISGQLATTKDIINLMKTYTLTCNNYANLFLNGKSNMDYTKMIKADIDYSLFNTSHTSAVDSLKVLAMM